MNFIDKRKIPILLRKFKYNSPQSFLYTASTIVGLIGGLAAVLLKNIVHWTEELVYSDYTEHYYIWTIFLPAIGILLTVLYIHFFVKKNITDSINKMAAPFFTEIFHISRPASYPALIGMLSGYPIGAKTVAQMYEEKQLDKAEAQYLLCFWIDSSNNIYIASACL